MSEERQGYAPRAPAGPPIHLEGVVERVTFASADDGYSVVRLQVRGRRELVTAVGSLPGIQPGESVRLTGRWVMDRKYGEQFKAEACLALKPATLVGIEKYLGSGLVRGVGRVMAGRLVERFGLETLDVIESQPGRLTEVEGIGPVRRERIQKAWEEQRAVRQVMVFLQSHGVSSAHAVRIYKTYRDAAIATVTENPYRLALDVFGIGFKTADKIARNLGIPADSPRRVEAGLLHVLGELGDEGHLYFPRGKLVERAREILEVTPELVEGAVDELARLERVVVEPAVAREESPVYLGSLHAAEAGSARLLRELLRVPVQPIRIDVDKAVAWYEAQAGIELAPEQREAIRRSTTEKVLVITGGPGTGKTTLVNGILRILSAKGRRIALAAPTGRAAKRLSEATGREAKTLHRLLEFNPKTLRFDRDGDRPLEADLLVVDETSMVDQVLGYSLLKALPGGCQLVLVGDVDQLPSVGPGDLLSDLIESGAVPVVRLSHIFRQAQESLIVVNAHRVNRGERLAHKSEGSKEDFFFIEADEPEKALALIKTLVAERIPRRFGLDPVGEVQVLTPMHRGLLGAGNLNQELQALLNPHGTAIARGARQLRVGDKVMQVRNNYDLEVFNGDLGRIAAIDEEEQRVLVRVEEREVAYDFAELDELALAYACSIHKSQGSEYPCVVVPVHTQHFVMLQRNLLYTAITRGRKLVVLVGSRRALAMAIRNAQGSARYTGLAGRLAAPA